MAMIGAALSVLAQASGDLPVDFWRWVLALSPILLLLVLLMGLNWGATEAGPVSVLVAAVAAMVTFETPLRTVVVAGGKGVWDAFPILLVIAAALLLYRVGTAAGAFHALRVGVQTQSRNAMFLVLGFGWVFASFTQGIAGFGAPIAIVAPLLVALGVRPLYAVVFPLIGHAWANFFGTVGVGWLATLQVVDVDDVAETAIITSLLLIIPIFSGPIAIAWMLGRMAAVRHALPMILILSAVLAIGQLLFVMVSPELSTFLAGAVALLALYPMSRWSRYSEESPVKDLRAMSEEEQEKTDEESGDAKDEANEEPEEEEPEPVMGLGWALAPYAVLTVVAMAVLLISPVESALEKVSISLPFPETSTGYDVVNDAEGSYEPFSPLTHAGGFLLIAAAAAWAMYRARGYFKRWQDRADPPPIWSSTASDAIPAASAVVTFLILAAIMSHSGQTETLALGIANVAPPLVFAFLANFIGIIGALVTSSSTSSNVLFAPLQDAVAIDQDYSQSGVLAAQSVGGAIGNVIAPANIVLGTTTAGISGQEGAVLRKTMLWALAVGAMTGLATMPFI